MEDKERQLLVQIRACWAGEPERQALLDGPSGLHLAICEEPYVSEILAGRKTIESRWGADRRAPYNHVASGDLVLMKRKGGPMAAALYIQKTGFICLDELGARERIRAQYGGALRLTEEFWSSAGRARYVSLLWIGAVWPLPALALPGQRRWGWKVLREASKCR